MPEFDKNIALPTPFGALLIRLDTKMDNVQASISKLDTAVSSKADTERVKALEERTRALVDTERVKVLEDRIKALAENERVKTLEDRIGHIEEKQDLASRKLYMLMGGLAVAEFVAKAFFK